MGGLISISSLQIQEAIPERNEHQDDFNELTESLQVKCPELLEKWKHEVDEWEADQTKMKPFQMRTEYAILTQAAAQHLLKRVSNFSWLATNPRQHSAQLNCYCMRMSHRASLSVQELTWKTNNSTSKNPPTPEEFILHLPSQVHHKVMCPIELENIEWRLREGQAHNALGANTCAHNCLKSIDDKVNASAAKYHTAHAALLSLSNLLGKVGWMETFQLLEDDNIHGMSKGFDEWLSEGQWKLLWIWLKCGQTEGDTDDGTDEGLQDARAQANQWGEEVELLFEEKHRILAFLEWHVAWWSERANTIITDNPVYAEGLRAYAEQQASLRWDLVGQFTHTWHNTQQLLDIASGDSEEMEGTESTGHWQEIWRCCKTIANIVCNSIATQRDTAVAKVLQYVL
ncbi:hypothetical protein PAXINDRAFT_153323 [Paxillus involutus ATCC 200175]|nr:hypothetical protein PAXINDRAFT_153323 [Paxillus involutus ATCC 200175]